MKCEVCTNCGGVIVAESLGWRCKNCRGFISLQDGKFFEYVEKPFMPPMTNADRIRAMSDEELSVFLWEFDKEEIARTTEYALERRKITEWLKQPSEEETQTDCTYNKNGHCIGQKLMPECDPKNCDRKKP